MDGTELDAYVLHNMPVAQTVIRKARRGANQSQWDDIESDGMMGLLSSAKSWKKEGQPPPGWVATAVKRSIIDGIRTRFGRPDSVTGVNPRGDFHFPLSLESPASSGEPTPLCDTIPDSKDRIGQSETFVDLVSALNCLPRHERDLIVRVFVMGDTMKVAAKTLRVTESRVSQVCTAVLLKLRKRMTVTT